jgi:hypothetical protein
MGETMPVDEAYAIAGFRTIDVDIQSLSDFAAALRQEVEVNLKPAWERISALLDQPRFGRSDELGLGEKRSAYDGYLEGARLYFQNVITGTVQLADAAETIAAHYRETDQFTAIEVGDVTEVLPTVAAPGRPTPFELRGI